MPRSVVARRRLLETWANETQRRRVQITDTSAGRIHLASNMDTYLEHVQIVDTLPGEQLIQSHVQIEILLAHLLVPEHPHIL